MDHASFCSAIDEGPVEAALAEYFSRLDRGESVDLTHLIARHSGCEAAVLQFLHQEQKLHAAVAAISLAAASSQALDESAADNSDATLIDHAARIDIGPYRLVQRIGEGGMGSVWLAEQQKPVRRQVALKLIRPGHDTKRIIARFEAERQVLAMMDHPNIAQVFDAGVSEDGRPYFAMELVRGVPFVAYCDQHRLTPRERLELFVPVCQAIQHAHQKGIIHRDIKPSNLLVTSYDGRPVPKVIDFGLAKALQQEGRLTENTVYTEIGQVVGTIQYMSPEQAELNALDIDTRSDIYSLGVVLYELLTGSTPLDRATISGQSVFRSLEMIREHTPPRPSERLSVSCVMLPMISEQRRTEPHKLRQILCGDLDWIVMKAIEKDRRRRYETAAALSDDVRRFLAFEPVLARPPSPLYRTTKFIQRNKVGVAMTLAVIAALSFGLALASISFLQTRAHALRSEQVAQFLQDMLSGVGPSTARGRDTAILREILDKATTRVRDELKDQPAVQASLFQTIGVVYRELGQYAAAETSLHLAIELCKQSYGGAHSQLATTLHYLGDTFKDQRKDVEADAAYREALEMRRQLFGHHHADVAASMFGLAEIRRRGETRSSLDDAEVIHREALAIRRKLLGNHHPHVAKSLTGLGITLHKKNAPEAEPLFREALRIQRRVLGNDHPDTAHTLYNLGINLRVKGAFEEAEQPLREAVEIHKKVLGDHRATAYSLNFLGDTLRCRGEFIEAEQLHRQALAMQVKVLGENPEVAVSHKYLGHLYEDQGHWPEAEKAYEEAFAINKKVLGSEHPDTVFLLSELARSLCQQQKFENAEAAYREVLAAQKKLAGVESFVLAETLVNLSEVLLKRSRLADAEAMLREADDFLADLGDAELAARAEELREHLVEMQAGLEEDLNP